MKVWLQSLVLGRRTALLVAFAAGSLYALAFAPFYVWPVIFISFPLLYGLLITSISRAQALWRGFFFGYGFFMAGTWWIVNALLVDADKFGWMLPFSVLGLSAAMALWFMPFAYLIYQLRARMTPLLFAALWVLIECARSFGIFGFPWNLAGYVSIASLVMAQGASIIGVYGLGFAVVSIGLLPMYWLRGLRIGAIATAVVCSTFLLAGVWGANRLHAKTSFTNTMLRIMQPNVPQAIKGTKQGAEVAAESLGRLTGAKPTGKAPDVIIWPETAYPYNIRTETPAMVPGFKGVLLTGAIRAEGYRPEIKIWNSLVALSPGGDILATYDKHQLVPFGEFVPLRSVLPLDKITPGDIDFSRGEGAKTINIGTIPPFSPLICYEGIFPALAVDPDHRPSWLLNITNDGWYGISPGPYQHFDMVRMRAIEQGLPLVRVANSGISAVIDSKGRVIRAMPLASEGYADVLLPTADNNSPYISYGYIIIIGLFIVILLLHLIAPHMKKS